MISICALAVKIVFLFADREEPEEGGGDVRVVVSGPRAGDTAMWSPGLAPDTGEKAGETEQGMLSTGGNTAEEEESDICEDSGTLTVLTEGARREAGRPQGHQQTLTANQGFFAVHINAVASKPETKELLEDLHLDLDLGVILVPIFRGVQLQLDGGGGGWPHPQHV